GRIADSGPSATPLHLGCAAWSFEKSITPEDFEGEANNDKNQCIPLQKQGTECRGGYRAGDRDDSALHATDTGTGRRGGRRRFAQSGRSGGNRLTHRAPRPGNQ